MKKIGFVIGCVISLIGYLIFLSLSTLTKLLPVIGKMYSNFSENQQYSILDYTVSFYTENIMAIAMVISGIILAVYCFKTRDIK